MEIIIYSGSGKKHIHGQEMSFPKGLQHLMSKLYNSVELAKVEAISDTIKFESTLQNSMSATFIHDVNL